MTAKALPPLQPTIFRCAHCGCQHVCAGATYQAAEDAWRDHMAHVHGWVSTKEQTA